MPVPAVCVSSSHRSPCDPVGASVLMVFPGKDPSRLLPLLLTGQSRLLILLSASKA